MGEPSTSTCASSRCQPRGRITSVARRPSFSAYVFSSVWKVSRRRTASDTAHCPVTTFCQVGERASSKSAMKTLAPEFRALIIIFGSTGPVISTRRSSRSAGAGATRQSGSARTCVGVRQEVGQLAGVEPSLAVSPLAEQALPALVEGPMQLRHEGQRLRRQDLSACSAGVVTWTPGASVSVSSTSCSLSRRC